MWRKYISELDFEIEDLVAAEVKKLTTNGEKLLHILFENRKHAIELMEHNEMENNMMQQ